MLKIKKEEDMVPGVLQLKTATDLRLQNFARCIVQVPRFDDFADAVKWIRNCLAVLHMEPLENLNHTFISPVFRKMCGANRPNILVL